MTTKSLLAALILVAAPLGAQAPAALFAEPSPSPDGREIAFVSGGDIWAAPAGGGEARLLVAHASNDFRPRWSPDGRKLAFVSTRTGNGDIYVLDIGTNALRRLTFEDALEQADAWSPDGEWIYFSSSSRDIAGMHDVMRVRATGGTPMMVAADRYASEYFAAPSPDGRRLAVTARGVTSLQWWRRGSSHIDEAELWFVTLDTLPRYTRFSTGERPGRGRDLWPMWSRDGTTVYFVSDRGGTENLWSRSAAGGEARALTRFTDGRVLWPQVSADGARIVFERDFRLWSLDIASGRAAPIDITLRGAPTTPVAERLSLTTGVQAFALSPDAKKLALIVRGEVFAADAKDGGDAVRVTNTVAPEAMPAWAPDSRRIAYASWRDGRGRIHVYDFGTRTERALTAGDDLAPRWSPDGAQIAYVRGGNEIRVVNVASGDDRLVVRATQLGNVPFVPERNVVWSPDGSHLAYLAVGARGFLNAYVVPASGGAAQQVSFLANAFGGTIAWSPDARALYFDNTQRTEDSQIIRVDLVVRTPTFREAKFDALFPADTGTRGGAGGAAAPRAGGAAAGAATVRIDTAGLRRRAESLDLGLDAFSVHVSPDGKMIALLGDAAGQTQIWTWPIDEAATEAPQLRQVTSSAGGKGNLQWSPDSKEIWFLSGGRVQAVGAENRAVRSVSITAAMDVEFHAEKEEVFRQVWGWTRDNFYDERMHGANWNAVRARYAPVVAASRTSEELRRALGLMIGELNASHTGVGGPSGSPPSPTGRLGLDFDRGAYERSGALRVRSVLAQGPAAVAGIRAGEFVLAVNGAPLDGRSLDSALTHTVGRRTILRIGASASDASAREVAVQPISTGAEKALRYREWVEERRAYVARESGGRFGYVHMLDMGQGSLTQLYTDLDAENHGREGVIIDIRNNNGGFVNAYALDVFSRRPYMTMERRGSVEAPARLQLGQRAFEKPTVLVTNQHSLSDAEDFTEGYRSMRLGPVVGEPTSGWIIYTSNLTLFDGTTLRMPFIRIRDAAGEDMELKPRPVDVRVDRPMGEAYGGRDAQLDAAIRAPSERMRR